MKGRDRQKRNEFDTFHSEMISPLIRARKYEEAIEHLDIEWEKTGSFDIADLFLTIICGVLLASRQYDELLLRSEKMVAEYPQLSHGWDQLASTHFHAFHRSNRRPLLGDIEEAFKCWEKALEVEDDPKHFYFIACNYLRALVKLKRWKVMENVISHLPKCLNPEFHSMDDVMPIENDWLTNCPDDVISSDILNEYHAACEAYIKSKRLFLEKEGLL